MLCYRREAYLTEESVVFLVVTLFEVTSSNGIQYSPFFLLYLPKNGEISLAIIALSQISNIYKFGGQETNHIFYEYHLRKVCLKTAFVLYKI